MLRKLIVIALFAFSFAAHAQRPYRASEFRVYSGTEDVGRFDESQVSFGEDSTTGTLTYDSTGALFALNQDLDVAGDVRTSGSLTLGGPLTTDYALINGYYLELYGDATLNQDVSTTSSPTLANLTVTSALGTGSLTVNSYAVNVTGISTINQNVSTTGSPVWPAATTTGNLTFGNSAGSLKQGATTRIDNSGNGTLNALSIGATSVISAARVLDNVTIGATAESNIESVIDTLANLTSVQGQTLTLGGSLGVESASLINQDLTTDATGVAFGSAGTSGDLTFGTTSGALKQGATTRIDASGNGTLASLSIDVTPVISSGRQLQNIASWDATTQTTAQNAITALPNLASTGSSLTTIGSNITLVHGTTPSFEIAGPTSVGITMDSDGNTDLALESGPYNWDLIGSAASNLFTLSSDTYGGALISATASGAGVGLITIEDDTAVDGDLSVGGAASVTGTLSVNSADPIMDNTYQALIKDDTQYLLALESSSSTGNEQISFGQNGTRRSYILQIDTNDEMRFASEFGPITFWTAADGSEVQRGAIDTSGNLSISGTQTEFGGIYAEGNATATTVSAATTYYQVTIFDGDLPENGTNGDYTSNNITISAAGTYRVTWNASFFADVTGASPEIHLVASKNGDPGGAGTLIIGSHATRQMGAGADTGAACASTIHTFAASDVITFWVYNATNTNDITVVDCSVTVEKL